MFGLNPWVLLGLGAAWVFSIISVGAWQHKAGATAERLTWQEREAIALADANKRIIDLTTKARAMESQHAARIAVISTEHQQEIKNAKAQRDRDVAAAYSGGIRLQYRPIGLQASGCATPTTGTTTPGRDGDERAELPPSIAADLLALAHDADDTARQLAACQQVIIEDRRLVNRED